MFVAYTDDGRVLVVDDQFVASRLNGTWKRGNLFTSAEWRNHFRTAEAEQARLLAVEALKALNYISTSVTHPFSSTASSHCS